MGHLHSMGCGCGMNGLGQAQAAAPAGPVAGIAMVTATVRAMVADARRMFGEETFDPANFDRLRSRVLAGERIDRLTREETRDFVLGTIAQMIDAVARATQLSQVTVSGLLGRNENWSTQNSLLGPAALMGDKAREILRDARPVTASGAASGLGLAFLAAIPVGAWVAGTVIAIVLGSAAIAAMTYWADASRRYQSASREADRICAAAGCSAAERARIVRELSGSGVFETAVSAVSTGVGQGLGDAAKILIVGGTAAGVFYFWWASRQAREAKVRRTAAREYLA